MEPKPVAAPAKQGQTGKPLHRAESNAAPALASAATASAEVPPAVAPPPPTQPQPLPQAGRLPPDPGLSTVAAGGRLPSPSSSADATTADATARDANTLRVAASPLPAAVQPGALAIGTVTPSPGPAPLQAATLGGAAPIPEGSALVTPAQGVSPPAHVPASAPSTAPAVPTVARQLARAFVQLTQGPSTNTLTVQLDPAGLGHVQVRIERDASGNASVQVTAEHPDTLRMLVSDQPHLHRALDEAGLSGDGRSLSFSLANPGGGMFSGAETGGGGRPGGGRSPKAGSRPSTQDEDTNFAVPPAWFRAGVNITA